MNFSALGLRKYFNIGVFYLAIFIRAMLLLTPITLLFYQENGLSVKELFFFQGIFYLVSILIELPVGYIADCVSRKYVLVISVIVYLIANVLWFFHSGYWIILCGEILYAISKVSMDIANSGYLYDYLATIKMESHMPKYLGYLNFYLAAGTAVVCLIGAKLYENFGSSNVLIIEIILLSISSLMLLMLKDIPSAKKGKLKISERYKDFLSGVNFVWNNDKIRDYILYSGLLVALSILLALAFQPLMLKAAFSITLFGVVTCANHGLRAVFSAFAGRVPFKLYNMRVPLYIAFILCFIGIFILSFSKNVQLNLVILLTICIIIGFQLLFTILHIARIHKNVDSSCRGMAMSVNNVVPKILTVIILLSSHFFMNNTEMWKFYMYFFVFFLISGAFLLVKTKNIKE